jgi:hypothetical protein
LNAAILSANSIISFSTTGFSISVLKLCILYFFF